MAPFHTRKPFVRCRNIRTCYLSPLILHVAPFPICVEIYVAFANATYFSCINYTLRLRGIPYPEGGKREGRRAFGLLRHGEDELLVILVLGQLAGKKGMRGDGWPANGCDTLANTRGVMGHRAGSKLCAGTHKLRTRSRELRP